MTLKLFLQFSHLFQGFCAFVCDCVEKKREKTHTAFLLWKHRSSAAAKKGFLMNGVRQQASWGLAHVNLRYLHVVVYLWKL